MNILMGFVACFLGTFVLSVLFMLDKHLFYYQRLIIYLNVSVILGGLVSITSINPFLVDDSGELTKSTFCTINGYLFNWSILTQHVLIWWMSIDAFILSMRNIRSLKPQNSISTIEIIAVLAAFLVPPLLLSIPALPSIDQYGPDGPLCDIQKFDFIKCEPILLGYILLCIYRFLPFSLSIIVLPILFIISTIKIQREIKRTQIDTGNNCQYQEVVNTKHTALQLQMYPLLYVIFSVVPGIYFVADIGSRQRHVPKLVIYFLYILIRNFRGIAVSLAFSLDKDTRSRLRKTNVSYAIKMFARSRVRKNQVIHSYSNERNLYTSYGDSLDAKQMRAVRWHQIDKHNYVN